MWFWGVLAVVGVLLAVCWYFCNVILYPKTYTPEESLKAEVTSGHLDYDTYQQLSREELIIDSPFGYKLYGLYIANADSNKTVIISHGITRNAIRSLRYISPFYHRGFNILCIEHRNHGRSGGKDTSYGHYEKYDMKAWVDWMYKRDGEICTVGVHGESMGSAIAILHAAIDSRIAFIVADCPYARIADQFAYRLKVEYHLPRFPFIPIANLMCKLRTGFSFNKAAPLDVISRLQLPVLFIHGEADSYIPPQSSRVMYELKPGVKQLWIAPKSEHAETQPDYPSAYDQHIGGFLTTAGVL
jgi:fermentation-respiration switch protein FrsA (DUF1100 family)